MSLQQAPLLEVKDLSISFPQVDPHIKETDIPVIKQLNFTVQEGEIVAIVGASGSGKSLLADAILGILPKHAQVGGEIYYRGHLLTEKKRKQLRGKEISLIPQSVNALDPLMKAGKQVDSMIREKNKTPIRERLFTSVGLAPETAEKYPFELSGGMQRRVLVATALGTDSNLIIADEPTPGLDPKVLNNTVHELKKMVTDERAMVFITHDIAVALQIADKIVVFKDGKTVEIATADQFVHKGEKLQDPYSKKLWNALPQNEFIENRQIEINDVLHHDQLKVKNIRYDIKNNTTLFKNVQFSLHRGEIVGLYGPSGAGKTTFAQIIGGYKTPTTGEIYINEEKLSGNSFQQIQLIWQHPEQTINPMWKMQKVLEEAGQIDESLLHMLGIKKIWLSRYPRELSGGELQRFCVARALMTNAIFIIADEMTTMLDTITQAKLWDVMLYYAKQKKIGMLVISHDTYLLEKVADRTIDFKEIL